ASVVAYHNAWPYLARRFRLDIVAAIEPKEGVAPSATRLARLAAAMRDSGARLSRALRRGRAGTRAGARRRAALIGDLAAFVAVPFAACAVFVAIHAYFGLHVL